MPIMWTYPNFAIRAKNSSGAIQLTWWPVLTPPSSRTFPVRIGPVELEQEKLQRELLNRDRRGYVLGWRARLTVAWRVQDYQVLGQTGIGYGSLHEVLAYERNGGYLELSLNGSYFRRVEIESMRQTNVDGRNVALELEITFVQTSLKTTVPGAGQNSW